MLTLGCSFGELHFGSVDLGDQRRNARLVQLVNTMVKHPGGTLPDKVNKPADLKALYRLMDCPAVTHAAVLAPHRHYTWQRMREQTGVVLVIHDTTELDYSGLSIAGLGQLGEGHGHGYKCHNSLAVVAESREVLGLANQILFNRPHVPKDEKKSERLRRANRESRLWTQGSEAIPAAPAGCQWIDVCDRAADITEFLDFERTHAKDYVVRSLHNRLVVLENEGVQSRAKLHDWARTLPAQGERRVEVGAKLKQPSRTANVAVAWAPVCIRPPRQPRGSHGQELLPIWLVRAWEIDPPAGMEPLEWILLTNVPVQTLAEAFERVNWYGLRWIVEEYHKAMKTGCQVEDMQFTTEARLQPAIALVSVTAIFLLNLRDASRREDAATRPASAVIPLAFVEMLSLWRHKAVRPTWTVHEFFMALARLGGHQNRKNDHSPGWLILWRGWTKLQLMVEAASLRVQERCG